MRDTLLLKLAELDLNYRGAALNAEAPGRRDGLHAGDRAPDFVAAVAATGEPTRFFDQLRGPHFTPLALADEAQAEALTLVIEDLKAHLAEAIRTCWLASTPGTVAGSAWDAVLHDRGDSAQKSYATGLYLVRPDGYIGFRGAVTDGEALPAYVRGWFRAPVTAAA